MATRATGRVSPPHAAASPVERFHHVAPGILALVLFAAVGVWDLARGFDLWMWYCFVGAGLGSLVVAAVYVADVRVPHYVWVVVSVGLLLHYVGGSLGQPTPGQQNWFGISGINGAYHVFSWWDHLTHFVGIAAAGVGFAYIVDVVMMRRGVVLPAWFVFAFGTVAALATGVAVELYEYAGKRWFQTIDQGGYANTLGDLVWNVIGAVGGAAFATGWDRRVLRSQLRDRWLVAHPSPRLLSVGPVRLSVGVTFVLVLSLVMTAGSVIDLGQYASQGSPPPNTPEDLAAYERTLGRLGAFTAWAFGIAAVFVLAALAFRRSGAQAVANPTENGPK